MKTEPKVVGTEHVIYGTWSDLHGHQVLVHYPPNSNLATVFILHGQDYGGGIDAHFTMHKDVVLTEFQKAHNDYEFYREMCAKIPL